VTAFPPPAEPRPPLTDSGWFWGLIFSATALAGLGLIGPKWDWRQRQLESRYLLADSAVDRELAVPARIVPAWTLAALAAAGVIASAGMLWRERR